MNKSIITVAVLFVIICIESGYLITNHHTRTESLLNQQYEFSRTLDSLERQTVLLEFRLVSMKERILTPQKPDSFIPVFTLQQNFYSKKYRFEDTVSPDFN